MQQPGAHAQVHREPLPRPRPLGEDSRRPDFEVGAASSRGVSAGVARERLLLLRPFGAGVWSSGRQPLALNGFARGGDEGSSPKRRMDAMSRRPI